MLVCIYMIQNISPYLFENHFAVKNPTPKEISRGLESRRLLSKKKYKPFKIIDNNINNYNN